MTGVYAVLIDGARRQTASSALLQGHGRRTGTLVLRLRHHELSTKRSLGQSPDPRNPLHGVVVIQLAEDLLRQVQALRGPLLELHVRVAREVSPVALVPGRPILEHVLRLV